MVRPTCRTLMTRNHLKKVVGDVPPIAWKIRKTLLHPRNRGKMKKNEKEIGCKKITKMKRGVGYRRKYAVWNCLCHVLYIAYPSLYFSYFFTAKQNVADCSGCNKVFLFLTILSPSPNISVKLGLAGNIIPTTFFIYNAVVRILLIRVLQIVGDLTWGGKRRE